ncbi:preprotein translocase subunit YajC [Hydrogenivirga sp. 128-5-R1-1]|uniref:preprotein translocase subunit YajC n=1 Tax=Hydrogenivirga sp. 128-5-R1-1 TaxID=392423 RepID=UPI00015EF8E4|nr:preprotein translocase subunit YajC [Hydrogenivirga sp. 128-5-R1-1]EDP74550.1 elongation factor Ts [Hydrogenivirga sp. 128-5-R1-1]
MIDIAFAQGQGHQSPTGAILFQVLFLVGIFAIFYFLIIRPQKKERERHRKLIESLKKGDKVITSAGIWGTVVEVGDRTVSLKVDANTRITFSKEAIIGFQPEQEKKKEEKGS